jgi:UDP-N-acetylglucosamine 2-epimerase (non-hydrolysing)
MRELSRYGDRVRQWLVHTGQHYDEGMSQVFFDDLDLTPPDENLEVGSGSHAWQTAQVMLRFEPVLLARRPDWVVVVGDVNSTMACTLVAAKLGIRVAHVEAGLRSYDRTMPEEINRLVTDSLADLLFTPSPDGDENLLREGVPPSRIRQVGNIMIDTLRHNLEKARARDTDRRLGVQPGRFVYVTLHRPSNVDERDALERIVDCLVEVSEQMPVVFPVHPRTRERLREFGLLDRLATRGAIRFLEPVGYHDSICLADRAACVLTDSGGLQEETTYLKVPCLTLRPNTERPITITEGSNRLTTLGRLRDDLAEAVRMRGEGREFPRPALWDGRTAERITKCLVEF